MGKPGKEVYLKFMRAYAKKNKELGLPQYLVPYFISSHPGCTLNNAIELAEFLRDIKHQPEQVQDFIPTPGSAATAMYYSGVDPATGETVFVARNPHDKAMQRALMQYRAPRNRQLVLDALQRAGRTDLIGTEPKCLLAPERRGDGQRMAGTGRSGASKAGAGVSHGQKGKALGQGRSQGSPAKKRRS